LGSLEEVLENSPVGNSTSAVPGAKEDEETPRCLNVDQIRCHLSRSAVFDVANPLLHEWRQSAFGLESVKEAEGKLLRKRPC
jgi:hypothetical protein